MKNNKYADLGRKDLLSKKVELENQMKELKLNSALTSLEKPHKKDLLKKEIARISTFLNREEL